MTATCSLTSPAVADGWFSSVESYPVGRDPYDVTVADLDADGDADVATANFVWPVTGTVDCHRSGRGPGAGGTVTVGVSGSDLVGWRSNWLRRWLITPPAHGAVITGPATLALGRPLSGRAAESDGLRAGDVECAACDGLE